MNHKPSRALDLAIVTGPHRSGTTFLASILATADRSVALGVEPLNATWGLRDVDTWYPEIEPNDDVDCLLQRLRVGMPVKWSIQGVKPTDRWGSYRRGRARNRRIAEALRHDHVVILKDPFLSLSLSYATSLTTRPIIVAVRHPAAWAMSLARVDWHPGVLIEDLLRRRQSVSKIAETLGLPRRNWRDAPLYEAAAWLWSLLVESVQEQSSQLGDAVVVIPLERFEADPVAASLSLIDTVGLTPAADSREKIEQLTLGTTTIPADATTHVLERDTRASLGAWRSAMGSQDRGLIWAIASPVASTFYEP